jgi:hypothetical protein
MKKARPPERDEERVARELVARELSVPVSRNDDGLADMQPDAIIHLTSGPVPLEVVRDHDVAYNRLKSAADKRGWRVSTSPNQPGWFVSLRHDADYRRVRAQIPSILEDVPVAWFSDGREPDEDLLLDYNCDYALVCHLLEAVGVVYLQVLSNEPGIIRLSTEGWNSWDDPIGLIPWISRVLERERDVSDKLQRHGGEQRHAFIWASPGTSWQVNSVLRNDDDDEPAIPDEAPRLPSGVTHLWVASVMSRRDVLYWSPTAGWKRASGLTI